MKISYDHQVLSSQPYGGISRYFCEIVGRIAAYNGCEVSILAPLHINRYATGLKDILIGVRVPRIPLTGPIRRALDAALAKKILQSSPPDVLHETYYSAHSIAPKQSRIVVTVHDMINEKVPEMVGSLDHTSRLKAIAVARADHVICVSENTRKDLVEILNVSPRKVSVIYHGCSFAADNGHRRPMERGASHKPFLLYVGCRGGYKNFVGLLRAYSSSARLKRDVEILCVGGGRFSTCERALIRQLGLEGEVHRVAGDDSMLLELYASAMCLVYPSFYEGFGMPVIEAMNFGCPVACSHSSCLPEIAGESAEYFDPGNYESIRAAVENVVYSETRSRWLAQQGKAQAAQYSWDRCAQQTCKVYSSLV